MTRHTTPLLCLCLLLTTTAAAESPRRLEADTHWQGVVSVDTVVVVAAGAELVLEPGAIVGFAPGASLQVEGTLRAEGRAEAPIRFQGNRAEDAPLIQTAGEPARVVLRNAELRGAKAAVILRHGSLTVEDSRFEDNGTAVALEIKSRCDLRRSSFLRNDIGLSVQNMSQCRAETLRFEGNRVGLDLGNSSRLRLTDSRFLDNDVGYGQMNACDAELRDTLFEDNRIGVGLRQTRRSPVLARLAFRGNRTAVSAQLFSHALVEASTFKGNGKGFDAAQFCGAFLRFNEFVENNEAIRLDHKSNARIESNRLHKNGVALFADYSSYPNVRGNLFLDNEWHVRLGIYQSADWEERQGSRGLMMETAREANSRNPMMLSGDVPTAENGFSVAGNAWDDATAAEMAVGGESNLTRFWDGRDQEPVGYEGFGEGKYKVDVIRFAPSRTAAGLAVGPAAWEPLEAATAVELPERQDPSVPQPGPRAAPPGTAPDGRP